MKNKFSDLFRKTNSLYPPEPPASILFFIPFRWWCVYSFDCRTGTNDCTGKPYRTNTETNYMGYTTSAPGTLVSEKVVSSPQGQFRWDLPENRSRGHYIVKAYVDGEQFVHKVVKQKNSSIKSKKPVCNDRLLT